MVKQLKDARSALSTSVGKAMRRIRPERDSDPARRSSATSVDGPSRQRKRSWMWTSPTAPEPSTQALPEHRERRLTASEGTQLQLQSSLISRIPVEIRLLIWEHLLGREADEDVLHLDLANGNLNYVRCFEAKPCDKLGFRHQCWGVLWSREERKLGLRIHGEPKQHLRKLRPLLLSCKLIYGEAVDVLYSANTFDTRRCESIIRLPQVLLPHRFQRIRRIRFSNAFIPLSSTRETRNDGEELVSSRKLRPPENWSRWPVACRVLASLEHLEELIITIAIWDKEASEGIMEDDSIIALMKPLKAVRARKFEVITTQALAERVEELLGPTPFRVSKRERSGIGYINRSEDD